MQDEEQKWGLFDGKAYLQKWQVSPHFASLPPCLPFISTWHVSS
jgi:hypothetical protein